MLLLATMYVKKPGFFLLASLSPVIWRFQDALQTEFYPVLQIEEPSR